jgi:hypothetical protein
MLLGVSRMRVRWRKRGCRWGNDLVDMRDLGYVNVKVRGKIERKGWYA